MGTVKMVEWEIIPGADCFRQAAGRNLPVFALELGGVSVSSFGFPQRGLAVIGSEELGVSPRARDAAEGSLGLVSVPIYGRKGSINVSAAFAIMMHRWAEA